MLPGRTGPAAAYLIPDDALINPAPRPRTPAARKCRPNPRRASPRHAGGARTSRGAGHAVVGGSSRIVMAGWQRATAELAKGLCSGPNSKFMARSAPPHPPRQGWLGGARRGWAGALARASTTSRSASSTVGASRQVPHLPPGRGSTFLQRCSFTWERQPPPSRAAVSQRSPRSWPGVGEEFRRPQRQSTDGELLFELAGHRGVEGQWPELCGRGASSLTRRRPSR
jgi:hypothetical protein